jgi:hypothetical protein
MPRDPAGRAWPLLLALTLLVAVPTDHSRSERDALWVGAFTGALADKVRQAEVIFVGRRHITLVGETTVSLYKVDELILGGEVVRAAMRPYPDVPGEILFGYPERRPGDPLEPEDATLVFLVAPPAPGKNLRLLGGRIETGMVRALPDLVRTTRELLPLRR